MNSHLHNFIGAILSRDCRQHDDEISRGDEPRFWKVDPQNRLRVSLARSAASGGGREVITALENRFDESGI
ncbi:hypothetical protein [Burkholderia savannae]|uniref:hypothetical protein n=1 Tax=Burkholderia savannae TaxID=1637837 RepID=UPI0012E38883|nr:hypothetical protein [Burkholderia savannae]